MTRASAEPTPSAGLSAPERARAAELFDELFGDLQPIGLAQDGSSTRLAWSPEIARAGEWFDAAAQRLGFSVGVDRNGNRWAWSDPEAKEPAILTGSHLDTVPRGGRFDGALGVVTGLIAAAIVMARGPAGKPLAVVSFADEEGGRFNTPTFGSRLLTGALAPEAVLDRVDGDGVTLAAAISDSGLAPGELGRDGALLERLEGFVELHIEQGSLLGPRGRPVGIATAIIPHGRWRITLTGEANHGGTAAMETRRDPMLPLAEVLRAGRRVAEEEDSLVTVGKVEIWPNAPTSIAERVTAWLDVRSEREEALEAIVEKIARAASASASAHRVDFALEPESRTPEVRFSAPLAARITEALARVGLDPVPMSTGAGHDAGVLAAVMPTAMLFVRNETGISHSRAESARREDCLTGIGALVSVLDELRDTPRPATSTPNGEARS